MPNHPRFTPTGERVVEILTYTGAQLLDIAGPLQVFSSANDLAVMAGRLRPYAPRVVSKGGVTVATSSGLQISTVPLTGPRTALDTLIVAGGPGVSAAVTDAELLRWLRSRARRAQRVASVCTGAFLLATVGILDQRRATTHWSFCDALATQFPAVRVERDPIFVCDGSVWSSAGVTAGIDLALALVEQDLGHHAALEVARHIVVFLKRPGGQAQFSEALALQTADDQFYALHDWVRRHLADDLSLPILAQQAGMSERSFCRRYLEATGVTPARAIERLRVEAARQLLTKPHLSIKQVARQCGFGSEETMRRSFLRLIAVPPSDYRDRFCVRGCGSTV